MSSRNEALDSLKGTLLILVILGHVLLGGIEENLGREIIYFFHMPLFLAVTGFFINRDLLNLTATEILKKYYYRMLIPFALAFIPYSIIWIIFRVGISFESILNLILYPYYHLWYIPAVLLYVFYAKVIRLFSKPLFVCVFILSSVLTILHEGFGQYNSDSIYYTSIGDKRFYCYFTYFYIGFMISNQKIKVNFETAIMTLLSGLLLYGYGDNKFAEGFGKFISNTSVILITLTLLRDVKYKGSFLSRIGKVSLPIYLWHVLPLLFLRKMPMGDQVYYTLCLILLSLFVIVVITLEGKIRYLNKYFYGLGKSPPKKTK